MRPETPSLRGMSQGSSYSATQKDVPISSASPVHVRKSAAIPAANPTSSEPTNANKDERYANHKYNEYNNDYVMTRGDAN